MLSWWAMVALDLKALSPERPRPLRRREYDRLVALGLFGDERVELLRGSLIEMSPADPPHAEAITRLDDALSALRGRARVRVQQPFAASDDSEPEPDVAVVPSGDYSEGHPDRAYLLVEVADPSLPKDRQLKAPVYAESGVQEYWIVNLVERVVEVHRDPAAGAWRSVTRHALGATLEPQAFPGLSLRVDDLLPRRR